MANPTPPRYGDNVRRPYSAALVIVTWRKGLILPLPLAAMWEIRPKRGR